MFSKKKYIYNALEKQWYIYIIQPFIYVILDTAINIAFY